VILCLILSNLPLIIVSVRRLFCLALVLGFALSLHASVPASSPSRGANSFGGQMAQPVFSDSRPALVLTAAPADVSFYEEFYPAGTARHDQAPQPPKTTVLHWFGNLIKKAVRR
jgi:hypothetical protein